MVCLLGAVGPDDVVDLIRGRSGPTTDAAVLMDLGSWVDAGAARQPARASARRPAPRWTTSARTPRPLLRAAGWRVAVARADRSVADVWQSLGGRRVAPRRSRPGAGSGAPA